MPPAAAGGRRNAAPADIDIPDIRPVVEHPEADTSLAAEVDIAPADTENDRLDIPEPAEVVVRNRKDLAEDTDVEAGKFAADTFRNCIAAVAVEDIPSYRTGVVGDNQDILAVVVDKVACDYIRSNCNRIQELEFRF